jgi:hypothetical protein
VEVLLPGTLGFESWQAFYKSDLQGAWAPAVITVLFLLCLVSRSGAPLGGADPPAAPFVRRYALLFGALTLLDPIATGPLTRAVGLEGMAATVLMLAFVLLGDFRVYLLLFGLRDRGLGLAPAIWRAARWTLLVPAFTWPAYWLLGAMAPQLPDQTLWLVYELAFLTVALVLRQVLVSERAFDARPALRRYLRAVLAYVALYYGLWASADSLILVGGQGSGWLLRALPNQLYYALWIPFVYLAFFSARYDAKRSAVQAAR